MQAAKKRFKILSNKLININIGQWYLKDLSSKKITSNNYDPFNIKNYCVWFLASDATAETCRGGSVARWTAVCVRERGRMEVVDLDELAPRLRWALQPPQATLCRERQRGGRTTAIEDGG